MAEPDTTGSAIWTYLEAVDYRNTWTPWPGKAALYTGGEPHGMLLSTYLNEAAMAGLQSTVGAMPSGAVIVKENYTPDTTLAAITLMYKHSGFNPEHNDWFFSKHLVGGTLDTMPDGTPMEGRVPGCENCHSRARSNDYVLTGPIGGNN